MTKTCGKCGSVEFYKSGGCIPCAKKRTATWVKNNKEKAAAYQKEYAEKKRDALKQYAAEYYLENAERKKEAARKWLSENREKANATKSKYRKANPNSHRAEKHNRMARIANNGGRLSVGLGAKLFRLQRGKCACCGLPLGDDYHLDHIMPLALGGSNTDDNIQLLRSKCNLQKNAKHPVEFMQQRGFLL